MPTPTKWDQINSQIVNMDYKNESVYCWGDSLTFGDGGNIDGWHAMDYPMILAQRWGGKVVNLGVPARTAIPLWRVRAVIQWSPAVLQSPPQRTRWRLEHD